jgi:hypothetical protein
LTHGVNGDAHTKDNKDQEDQVWFLVHRGVIASAFLTNISKMGTI